MKTHTVGDVMTSEVVQARRDTPFKDVVRLLDRHGIGGLPVVDHDDKVLGVISGTDLVRGQAARAEQGRGRRMVPGRWQRQRSVADACAATAEDLMTTPAITVHPEQAVPDAARMMERHHIERLPVVDEEDRLIGIATRSDLLRVFLRTDEDIRRQVVEEALVGDLHVPADRVVVSVRDGMVTLEGRTERRSDIPAVIRSTWRVDGVVGVMNSLTFRIDDIDPPTKRPSRRIAHYWLPER